MEIINKYIICVDSLHISRLHFWKAHGVAAEENLLTLSVTLAHRIFLLEVGKAV